MLLSEYNIIHYLIEKGLMSYQNVIDNKYTVHRKDSRNNNFIINKDLANQLFIKQIRRSDLPNIESLKTEATVYYLANNNSEFNNLSNFIPRYFNYDYNAKILITEYLGDYIDLQSFLNSNKQLNEDTGKALAETFNSYHIDLDKKKQSIKPFSHFKKQQPWVFNIPSMNLEQWKHTSKSETDKNAIGLIENDKRFLNLISETSTLWENNSLCHGDIKFQNILINNKAQANSSVKIIDWELAFIGDKTWDIAGVINSILVNWISSSSKGDEKNYLEKFYPFVNSLIENYECVSKMMNPKEWYLKLIKFTALRLIHSCFESTASSQHFYPSTAKLLQLSSNIFNQPDEALQILLGIKINKEHEELV